MSILYVLLYDFIEIIVFIRFAFQSKCVTLRGDNLFVALVSGNKSGIEHKKMYCKLVHCWTKKNT